MEGRESARVEANKRIMELYNDGKSIEKIYLDLDLNYGRSKGFVDKFMEKYHKMIEVSKNE